MNGPNLRTISPEVLCADGRRRVVLTLLLLLTAVGPQSQSPGSEVKTRGNQFMGFTSFDNFIAGDGTNTNEVVLTSPVITARANWDELIVSWNAEMPSDLPVRGTQTGGHLKVEARGLFPDRATKFFTLGVWSENPGQHPRQSIRGQADEDGDVLTDTLVLKRPCRKLQLRVTLGGQSGHKPRLKFLGISLHDSSDHSPALSPNRLAWRKTIPVPERSQMAYTNLPVRGTQTGGETLCSPATVSMMLGYWAGKLKRPELDRSVQQVAGGVFDPNWPGTGNWVFNTAYAGAIPGMRAYVTRLSDVSELEDWIAHGIPVGLSLCYNRLRGKAGEPSGHLVVCVGFTKNGDVIVNDPGTSRNVRKIFPRANLIDAWSYSKNAVYLIYPESVSAPADRFGHWDSPTTRRNPAPLN